VIVLLFFKMFFKDRNDISILFAFECNVFEYNIMYFSFKQDYKLLANDWMNPIFQFDL